MTKAPRTAEGRSLVLTALVISCAFLMETLDSTILIAALPAVAADFGVAPLRVNLAVTIYLVTLAAMIPASSWLADRFGARRVFLWAIFGFMVTSVGAALSSSLTMLVVMRVLQATAGAMMTPVGRLLLIRAAPKDELANAIAWMSMPVLIGPVLGPMLGGWLVTYASWPWIFLVNLPIGAAALLIVPRILPADAGTERRSFDLRGFLLCAAVLAAAQLLLDQLVHPFLPAWARWGLAALVPLAALGYWRHAARAARPALDLTLWRLRLFRIGFFAGGLSRLGLNAVPFLLQLQLQLGFGWSAARAGTTVFAVAAGALVLKPLMRRVLGWLGFRATLFWNGLLGAVLTGVLALLGPQTPQALLLVVVLAYGVARSLQFNAVNTLLYADVPAERQSASTALGGVGQQVSMALGISVAAILVAQFEAAGLAPPQSAISAAMIVVALLTALSGALFLFSLTAQDGAAVSRRRARPS
ncbi:MFS transporter [Mangrovicoccus algicola]|uniref:MFS transporter n=1 Tax=Mangrovicoccus algicola TaxID=2771008 RepID=A0A8J7CVI6_9RHOB|nr:MFS transporter [Mangrovicoccus algicola]MBE3638774.1 MFS transporter [Mangrovicoccus algicola]